MVYYVKINEMWPRYLDSMVSTYDDDAMIGE